jgi:cobalt-zinc-cadmium efflux system protein
MSPDHGARDHGARDHGARDHGAPDDAEGNHAGRNHLGHAHSSVSSDADARWLTSALVVLVVFMAGEVTAGLLGRSLALISDAGHLLTDVAALVVALIAGRIARRPARGSYTYGFARVDALAGQANGITLLILSVLFTIGAIRHLINPPDATGWVMTVVAAIGVLVNVAATALAKKADSGRLSVRGAVAHLVNDMWAFLATAVAGVVIILTGWSRADAVASLVIAALMAITGSSLVRAAGRVFLEAAPADLDPDQLGAELAMVDGVAQIHDLHVWQIGPNETALSVHVFVVAPYDCHQVAAVLRDLLEEHHNIRHATLQVEHAGDGSTPELMLGHCDEPHGRVHLAGQSPSAS